jgi:hypothetical protein
MQGFLSGTFPFQRKNLLFPFENPPLTEFASRRLERARNGFGRIESF